MKIKLLAAWAALIISASQLSFANEYARSLATDMRIKTVPYEKNNVVSVYGSTFITTQIIFGQNEKVIDIQGGDADAWTVNVSKAIPNVLNIKPTILNSDTDIIVSTIDHEEKIKRYFFHLKSNQSSSHVEPLKQTYAIRFIYPNDIRLNPADEQLNIAQNPSHYHWSYSFSGSRTIMPVHVFDDGKFTYFQLQKNQDIPAIFAVSNRAGKEAVVNFRKTSGYLVVQQVAPQFTLRDGQYHVASIFNNRLIQQMQSN